MAIKGARTEDGRVTPHLLVRGGRNAIEFYTRAFGATLLYESPMPDSSGIHAHLKVGRSMIMITDARPPSPDGRPLRLAGGSVRPRLVAGDGEGRAHARGSAGAHDRRV